MELVSIGRTTVEIDLFDTKGAKVKLYTSATVDQQTQIATSNGMKEDPQTKMNNAFDTIAACFVEWNIGKDGQPLPCNRETLKQFSQKDFLALLQACTGRTLIDSEGNILSNDIVEKKVRSA